MNAFDDRFYELLPTTSNQDLADMYGVKYGVVAYQRRKQGIASVPSGRRKVKQLPPGFLAELYQLTIPQLVVKFGLPAHTIRYQRHKHGGQGKAGKPSIGETEIRARLGYYFRALGIDSDRYVAQLAGVSAGTVRFWRIRLGIPPCTRRPEPEQLSLEFPP